MSEPDSSDPKLFISYSWSTPDHEAWVIQLAEELTSQGIHVILDKWDLQPGHDANAFMESMVSDVSVTKVLLICDEVYASKSDGRTGGAGTEAQIITPEIYSNTRQDKFAAVVRERDADGKAFLPVYYKGRIYFDLTDASTYSTEFDKIVRWAWNKQLHIRPTKGERPSFLDGKVVSGKILSSATHRRAMEAVRSSAPNAAATVREYFDIMVGGLEEFRLKTDPANSEIFDELVLASIEEFTPYRNEMIELFSTIARHSPSEHTEAIHRFFERCIPYRNRPEGVNQWSDWDYDNFRFITHELFLYCIGSFLKYEQFGAAQVFFDNEYYWNDQRERDNKMHSFTLFREHLKTLEYRNKRLELRRLSLHADILKERNKGTGVDFNYVMCADFIAYLRGEKLNDWSRWWPETLLYADRFAGPFEVFARAKSIKYFERIKDLLGVKSKEDLVALVEQLVQRDRVPRWQFDRLEPGRLIGLANLAVTP